jgi:hypothetical protein
VPPPSFPEQAAAYGPPAALIRRGTAAPKARHALPRRRSAGYRGDTMMRRGIGIALAAAMLAFGATAAHAANIKEYKTEAAARKHCPRDEVVYGTHKDRMYHHKEWENYGKVKGGRYVCLRDADKHGWHEMERH